MFRTKCDAGIFPVLPLLISNTQNGGVFEIKIEK